MIKIIYKTKDGELYAASSPAELVQRMRRASRTPAESDAEWMAQASYRAALQVGAVVRFDAGPEAFVEDAVKSGLLMVEGPVEIEEE